MSDNCFVVAFVSGKGGTGKTTLTANFATELASSLCAHSSPDSPRKNRVLVIDNDYATGGASYLLAGGERLRAGAESDMIKPETCFYDCYSNRIWADKVSPLRLMFEAPSVGEFEVHVMLNSLGWWTTPQDQDQEMDEDEIIKAKPDGDGEAAFDENLQPYYDLLLKRFRTEYDYILIDSRGGADTRASVAAAVADAVVIVTEPGDVASKQDASFIRSLSALSDNLGRDVTDVSVIYNRVLESDRKDIAPVAGLDVLGYLPISEHVVQSYRKTELIFESKPMDPFCIEAVSAFEKRFPGAVGICQSKRQLAMTLMKAKNLSSKAIEYLSLGMFALVAVLAIGLVIYEMMNTESTFGVLTFLTFIVPIMTLVAGCSLGFRCLQQSLNVHSTVRRSLWAAGALGAVVLACIISFGAIGGLKKVRDHSGSEKRSFFQKKSDSFMSGSVSSDDRAM